MNDRQLSLDEVRELGLPTRVPLVDYDHVAWYAATPAPVPPDRSYVEAVKKILGDDSQ